MRISGFFLAISFFFLFSSHAVEIEIDGLIMDQTRSSAGHAFHKEFVKRWSEPYGVGRYNMILKELPSARWGGRLQIIVNDRIVHQLVVQPRLSVNEEQINEAIRRVRAYLLEFKGNGRVEQGSEDLKGDGF